jgi:hypothetical protein
MRFCTLFTIFIARVALAQPWPLNQIPQDDTSRPVSILEIRILELKFGHEGPGHFPVERAFFRGRQELVEAVIFGQESLSTIRFEVVSQSGQLLSTVPAFRVGDGADADEYYLQVDVPQQAFHFRIKGSDSQGRPYASLFPKLFVPLEGAAPQFELPAGLSQDQSRRLQAVVDAVEEQTRARFASARNAYPDGTIRIARWSISAATYEPFLSPLGNVLGVRVRFRVRFHSPGDYAVTPYVSPLFANFRWRGTAGMKVLNAAVDPALVSDGAADALRYSAPAHFEAETAYQFRFDFVPDYMIRNEAGTRYCVNSQSLRTAGRLPAWEEIRTSAEPVKYRVDISSLNYYSVSAPMPPQKDYYEAFLREGALDCGPTPTTHF